MGLAPVLALWLALIQFETGPFEQGLAGRADAVLRERLGDGASAMAQGRDVTVSGMIFDESARAAALAEVAALPGVRRVADALVPPPPLAPYAWRAARDGATVSLSGGVPSPKVRAALVAAAQQAAPQAQIVDDMTYASGAPPGFAEKAAAALPLLGHLQSGEAQWRDGELTLAGQAATPEDYQAALALAGPAGAVKTRIAPPRAEKFAFAAENDGRVLRLAGQVGSEAERAALLAQARKIFPDVKVADGLQARSGAPPRFAAEAGFALRALAQLKNGKVALDGGRARLSGVARAGMDAAGVVAAVAPEPGVALDAGGVAAGEISPYVFSAEKDDKTLTLTGFCGDEDACAKIRAAAQEKFASLALADSMRRGPGAPKGFLTAALGGLEQLSRLGVGRFGLRDASARLRGDAVRATEAEAVRTAFIAAMPEGFAVQADVTGAEREEPAPPQPAPTPATPTPAKPPAPPAPASPPAPAPIPPLESAPPAPSAPAPAAPAPLPLSPPAVPSIPPLTSPKAAESCKRRLPEQARAAVIWFDYASADISPAGAALLDALASEAVKCPQASLEIFGHSDDVGSISHNFAWSWRRAETVAAFLLAAGVARDRLIIQGLGETAPLAPNDSDENRAKNRRIEIHVK
ncbi:OmpA family protein [Rhodoblastus sp.]|jgi:OOP family OmpA-OmpF porin|uniref:OmpA family protein n=1 Tax=Rhodoblastus sp. TaxID=1962975 RepID=UPI0025CB84FF|nr:OmpA family protein [Rhodoblastus sp.]